MTTALTVGLTGGLASGKSTLGCWLAEAGFEVVDADTIVAALYRPGGPGARAVESLFGSQVLDHSGAVDHARLADRVFADGLSRRRLEEAIHPLVRRHFQSIASHASGVAVLEVPLLVESGMATDFDLVVTVEADIQTRLERAAQRGLDEHEARARIAAQASEGLRRGAADIVIENDGDLAAFRRQADELIEQLRERASNE